MRLKVQGQYHQQQTSLTAAFPMIKDVILDQRRQTQSQLRGKLSG
ncbi:hypothetical protein [Arsenophonus sp. ENCA]|nr:hypothetical protein [Arsenophonus sp. ENCA]